MLICQKTPGCQKLDGHRSPCEVRPPRPYTPTTDEVRDAFAGHDFDQAIAGAQFDRWLAEVERAAANAVLVELLPVLEDAASNAYTVQNDRAIGDEMAEELARVEAAVERARAAALGLTAGQEGESDE